MLEKILESSLTSYVGLLFLILFSITYFSKKKANTFRVRVFIVLQIFTIFVTLFEVLGNLTSFGNSDFLFSASYHLNKVFGLLWSYTHFHYFMIYMMGYEYDKFTTYLKERRLSRNMTIYFAFYFLFYIASIFILPPITAKKAGFHINSFVLYFQHVVELITLIIVIVVNRKKLKAEKKMPYLLTLACVPLGAFIKLTFPDIAIFCLFVILHVILLYFFIENPDLYLLDEIKKLKDQAEVSKRTKSDFLSNMSHEIRSPMNAIVGFSEDILNSKQLDPEKTRNDIQLINSSARSLLDIINNILDISKVEANQDEIVEKEYTMKNLIRNLESIATSRIGTKNIKFVMDIDNNIPAVLYGDSTKLYQVLLNIVTNSIKYTEVGRIHFSLNQELNGTSTKLKFKVSDTGYGIKKEDYNKVFQKFSRLGDATSNEIEGTGLGLVITKKYVDLMGGKIWFESTFGVGTTFYLELNQKIIDGSPMGDIFEEKEKEEDREYLDCSQYTALIVDDDKLNSMVAKRLLEEYKFNVVMINSGEDCVYEFKKGAHYDIIFLDHMMPDMDGIDVVRILKSLIDYKIPPLVALTANAIAGSREMYLKEGFDDYLSKPINTVELDRVINKYFNK